MEIERITYLDKDAIRITADSSRELRQIRRDIEARGYWVITADDPAYSLIAHPDALSGR